MFSSTVCCFCVPVCDYTVRLYLHATGLCESYYRQVLLKDRRIFPLWFRYGNERLGFAGCLAEHEVAVHVFPCGSDGVQCRSTQFRS